MKATEMATQVLADLIVKTCTENGVTFDYLDRAPLTAEDVHSAVQDVPAVYRGALPGTEGPPLREVLTGPRGYDLDTYWAKRHGGKPMQPNSIETETGIDTSTMRFEATMTTRHTFTDRQLAGLVCCGFEGGVGYWCRIVDYREPTEIRPVIDQGMENPHVYRHNDYAFLPGGAVICQAEAEAWERNEDGWCVDDKGELLPTLTLDRKAIQRGLQVMAEKYPKHFMDFVSETEDACTGDVFLQCCMLGEVVYG